MKGLLKNLGMIMIVLGAVVLMVSHFTGNVNDNGILGLGAALVVLGLVAYIILNKKITD